MNSGVARQPIVYRDEFDYEHKQRIAQKSDERCAHCGKKVYFGYGATIDHFVPINKGGTNVDSNLVMLCYDCNQDKSNLIMPPWDYLDYLNEDYHEDILNYFKEYINAFDYIKRGNLFACDQYRVRFAPFIKDAHYHKKPTIKNVPVMTTLWIKRVQEGDLDRVKEYFLRYINKKKITQVDMDTAEKCIDFWFKFGVLYYIESNNEITMLFAMTICENPAGYEYISSGFSRCIHTVIMPLYNTEVQTVIAVNVVSVLSKIFSHEQDLNIVPMVFSMFTEDKTSYQTLCNIINYEDVGTDGILSLVNALYVYGVENDEEKEKTSKFLYSFEDILRESNKWIEDECKGNRWLQSTIDLNAIELVDKADYLMHLDMREKMNKRDN